MRLRMVLFLLLLLLHLFHHFLLLFATFFPLVMLAFLRKPLPDDLLTFVGEDGIL